MGSVKNSGSRSQGEVAEDGCGLPSSGAAVVPREVAGGDNHFNNDPTSTSVMDHFDQALKFIQAGRLDEARIYLEELLKQYPENVELLYNLGMLYTELGKPEKAIPLLQKCIEIAPSHANAHVALGFAYMSSGDLKNAKKYTLKALKIAPDNPFALRNLGGIFGKEGYYLNAFYHLQKSYNINPHDPQTVYGLAISYKSLNDFESAERYFKILLDMQAPEMLKEMAREGLGEIAFKTLKSHGPKMDVLFYILSALETFKGKSTQEIKDISFEIGLLGRQGFEINDPTKKYTLRMLPGDFTALQLVSIMYTGFKQFEPGLDIGMDFSEEYALALKLTKSEASL
jgi:tetratricopeptide (TPR) repeat protein